jgi:hypothetical protein
MQKTSHSEKLATLAGFSFPRDSKYGFFPLSRIILRRRVMRSKYPPFPRVPTMIPIVPASRALLTATYRRRRARFVAGDERARDEVCGEKV